MPSVDLANVRAAGNWRRRRSGAGPSIAMKSPGIDATPAIVEAEPTKSSGRTSGTNYFDEVDPEAFDV